MDEEEERTCTPHTEGDLVTNTVAHTGVSGQHYTENVRLLAGRWMIVVHVILGEYHFAIGTDRIIHSKHVTVAVTHCPPYADRDADLATGTSAEAYDGETNGRDGGVFGGFALDVLDYALVQDRLTYDLVEVGSALAMEAAVRNGSAAIGIPCHPVSDLDAMAGLETVHYFDSGLQIMIAAQRRSSVEIVFREIFTMDVLQLLCALTLGVGLAAHAIWLAEGKFSSNGQVPRHYVEGVWASIWFSFVTFSTVGYGDVTLRHATARLIGLAWILTSIVLLATITGTISATLTLKKLQTDIQGRQNLHGGKNVAVVSGSPAVAWAATDEVRVKEYGSVETALDDLLTGSLDAIVHDSATLLHLAKSVESSTADVFVVGSAWETSTMAFTLASDSPYANLLSRRVIDMTHNDEMATIEQRWFVGSKTESNDIPVARNYWLMGSAAGFVLLFTLAVVASKVRRKLARRKRRAARMRGSDKGGVEMTRLESADGNDGSDGDEEDGGPKQTPVQAARTTVATLRATLDSLQANHTNRTFAVSREERKLLIRTSEVKDQKISLLQTARETGADGADEAAREYQLGRKWQQVQDDLRLKKHHIDRLRRHNAELQETVAVKNATIQELSAFVRELSSSK